MIYKTLLEIQTEINNALDLENEDFLAAGELTAYINDGIRQCESKIHDTYEDYFRTEANIDLVLGTSEYSLPANIFANKIRGVTFQNGPIIYPVRRVRELEMSSKIAYERYYGTLGDQQDYRYFLKNDSATGGIKLVLLPTSRDTLTGGLKVWYLRQANILSSPTDLCDIPEFYQFVVQYAKVRIMEKDLHPGIQVGLTLLQQFEDTMVRTLSTMIPDDENTVEADYTHYQEHN